MSYVLDIANQKTISHSNRGVVDITVALIFISLMTNDFEHSAQVTIFR